MAILFVLHYLIVVSAFSYGSSETTQPDCEERTTIHAQEGEHQLFSINVHETDHYGMQITKYSALEGSKLIVDKNEPGPPIFSSQDIEQRTQISVDENQTLVRVLLKELKRSDGGIYVIKGRHAHSRTACFFLYIIGVPIVQLNPVPTSQIWTETGSNLVLECNSTSSTYPLSHGLSMHLKWSRNGVELINQGKLYVLQNLTKSDNGTVISCEAREEKGHKSASNVSLLVHWGPRNMTFEPATEYYKPSIGDVLPRVTGTADCYPPCKCSWIKEGEILSDNNTLSIGVVRPSSEGLYTFKVWRIDSPHKCSKSLAVDLNDDIGKPMPAWLIVVIVIFAAVVVPVILRKILLKLNFKDGRKTDAQNSQNMKGKELADTKAESEQPFLHGKTPGSRRKTRTKKCGKVSAK